MKTLLNEIGLFWIYFRLAVVSFDSILSDISQQERKLLSKIINIYLFKVYNENTRITCEICWKFIKKPRGYLFIHLFIYLVMYLFIYLFILCVCKWMYLFYVPCYSPLEAVGREL